MGIRLIELNRVLKPTGGLYLHCDPTASHYLRLLLDGIFGHGNFVNEISWKRTTTKSDFQQGAKNWPRIRDVIHYYAKDASRLAVFRQPFSKYSKEYVEAKYSNFDPDGRRYMLDNLTAPGAGSRGHPQYELMGVTRFWRYGKEKMEKLVAEGRVVQPSAGAVPRYKRYLDEMKGISGNILGHPVAPGGGRLLGLKIACQLFSFCNLLPRHPILQRGPVLKRTSRQSPPHPGHDFLNYQAVLGLF